MARVKSEAESSSSGESEERRRRRRKDEKRKRKSKSGRPKSEEEDEVLESAMLWWQAPKSKKKSKSVKVEKTEKHASLKQEVKEEGSDSDTDVKSEDLVNPEPVKEEKVDIEKESKRRSTGGGARARERGSGSGRKRRKSVSSRSESASRSASPVKRPSRSPKKRKRKRGRSISESEMAERARRRRQNRFANRHNAAAAADKPESAVAARSIIITGIPTSLFAMDIRGQLWNAVLETGVVKGRRNQFEDMHKPANAKDYAFFEMTSSELAEKLVDMGNLEVQGCTLKIARAPPHVMEKIGSMTNPQFKTGGVDSTSKFVLIRNALVVCSQTSRQEFEDTLDDMEEECEKQGEIKSSVVIMPNFTRKLPSTGLQIGDVLLEFVSPEAAAASITANGSRFYNKRYLQMGSFHMSKSNDNLMRIRKKME